MKKLYIFITLLLATLALNTAGANAATSISPKLNSTHTSCVMNVEAVSAMACYANNKVANHVLATRSSVGNVAAADTTVGTGSVVLGYDYYDALYKGSRLTWVAQYRCDAGSGHNYSRATMPSGWGNEVSSSWAPTGSACKQWLHYEYENYKGLYLDCSYIEQDFNYCKAYSNFGYNDRTSSEVWTKSQY